MSFRGINTTVIQIRRQVFTEVARMAYANVKGEKANHLMRKIPYTIIPGEEGKLRKDIFAALKKVRPDSCLLLVGEGELRAELEAKAARLGIAQDVKFLGVQSDTSVWYQAMDVFVMPSLFEGLPVVGMEAQASGLPCVFSTGVTEEVLLRPDSCRISLEQPDEAWAAVLKDADRNLPDRAQAAAQVRAAGYDIRQETLRLQQLYTGLIAKRGAAHA